MIICAGNGEDFHYAKAVGVGLVNSAIELSRICLQHKPSWIIFIGSAGSYDDSVEIGRVFACTHAANIELSFLESSAYTPIDNSIAIESSLVPVHTLESCNIKMASANSSNYITNTAKYNKAMLNANIMLENMEVFSVLKAAQYFNIGAMALLCVSNVVGKDSHASWVKSRDLVRENLGAALRGIGVI